MTADEESTAAVPLTPWQVLIGSPAMDLPSLDAHRFNASAADAEAEMAAWREILDAAKGQR